MDRRRFLKWIPKLTGAAAVTAVIPATITPQPKVEVLPPEDRPLTDTEKIELANAAAICFGLRPASPMSNRVAIARADINRGIPYTYNLDIKDGDA